MAQMNMKEAIRDALRVELKRDPNVLLFGEDVGHVGGVFRATEGLQKNLAKNVYSILRWRNPQSGVLLSVWVSKDSAL